MKQQLIDNLQAYKLHYCNHLGFTNYSCFRKVYLASFNSCEAFILGSLARQMAVGYFKDKCAIIDITLADGQCLFHCVVNDVTTPFSQLSVERKRKTAMKFGCSSMQVQHIYFPFERSPAGDATQESLERHKIAYDMGENDAMAGSIPIFLTSLIGPPVACITIDGLEPYENHWLAFESLTALVQEQRNATQA
ncbi:ZYRO0F03674p [Zygosaccharomyces rouxii]|uniref:ZYRO0F03674p n=1 Tax=Zygosaccharomyces rouxii (strain ATCC 2623 / CBS 732 / NBRC 1130 / NCYC 568 / NRRL Y-229) TaxID=559307 RepID=C5DXB4_ZYGRC|nr:uncharacterized protein ZYRO0F03674g [Zygosaccharomyces rouxii]KAH9199188.1 hypothetical protein LQ764DRAFT_225440 [Zygosaccharomyces rouxii]CAR28425.1 ZYRO0F03674p [Zygosaccharomyces rouxii]